MYDAIKNKVFTKINQTVTRKRIFSGTRDDGRP